MAPLNLRVTKLMRLPGLVLLLLLAGCGGSSGASTPEEAAKLSVLHPSASTTMQGFQVLGVRSWSSQAIVIYGVNVSGNGQGTSYRVGHVMVVDDGSGWIDQTGGASSTDASFRPEWKVCYAVALGSSAKGDYAIAYGRLPSAVAAVEVEFANGDKLTDNRTGEVFAVVDPHATTPTILRTLGTGGQTLYQVGLPAVQPPNLDGAMSTALTCVP